MKTPRILALGLVAAALSACSTMMQPPAADFKEHLGLQLYSLRAQFRSGVPGTLDLIKGYGVSEVETYSGTGATSEVLATELKARGLKPVSAHIGMGDFQKDVNAVIATAKALGVQYVIVPILSGRNLKDEDAHRIANDFNKWGAALKAAGLKFGFHTHGAEMGPSAAGNGETIFDIMMRETKPDLVTYEMDVFWTYQAGQDPVKLLNKYPDRWAMIHIKDLRKEGPVGLATRVAPVDNVTIGTGQINWPAVLATAQKIGVKHYFIEDETPTPLTCIPDSLTYLRALKL